jgi:putative restriction endonuclease
VDFDTRLRLAAFDWLRVRSNDGTTAIKSADLADFRFEGEPFRLIAPMQGIWKPSTFDAALSIRTAYRPEGADRPYEDMFSDDGIIHYKWRGIDANHYDVARAAMECNTVNLVRRRARHIYRFPVYLAHEDREAREFVGTFDELRDLVFSESILEERLRRYVKVETKKRLHQPVFRATVLRAYRTSCAVCSLRHGQLLDVAHIVADSAEAGIPSVRNGLALCKIHHAAFDANILGIRADLVVEIREDLLHENDGPMLKHGLQQRHNQKLLVIPRRRTDLPDPDRLAQRYEAFRTAS